MAAAARGMAALPLLLFVAVALASRLASAKSLDRLRDVVELSTGCHVPTKDEGAGALVLHPVQCSSTGGVQTFEAGPCGFNYTCKVRSAHDAHATAMPPRCPPCELSARHPHPGTCACLAVNFALWFVST